MSIETLEIEPGGLIFKEANVRLFNSQGEQIHLGKYGARGFTGAFNISSPPVLQLADTGTHEVGHWMGVAAETQRFEDSPKGGGMHFVASWPVNNLVSPRDPASGLAVGRRVSMPDGKSVEGVAYGIFSYEELSQPVESLERVELLSSGVGSSLELSKMGLLYEGFRLTGGGQYPFVGQPQSRCQRPDAALFLSTRSG